MTGLRRRGRSPKLGGYVKSLKRTQVALGAMMAAWAVAQPAWAQRSTDNALASSEDAFGTTVGNESIGLYNARDVRGFDPVQAGNIRLEGLYFDRQMPNQGEILISTLVSGSSVRVGLSAQSYLFPAPTGINDVNLRIPGDKPLYTAVGTLGFYHKAQIETSAEGPIIADKLSVLVGAGYIADDNQDAAKFHHWMFASTARWQVNDDIEVIPFWSKKITDGMQARANVFTAGSYLPPKTPRHVHYFQPWARNFIHDDNFGAIVNAALSENFRLRAGLFRSLVVRDVFYSNLYENTQPNGLSDFVSIKYPRQDYGSYSGEVRLSGVTTTGNIRHSMDVSLRGRLVSRGYGGADREVVGKQFISVPTLFPEPVWDLQPINRERTRHGTGGISYQGLWAGVGEMSIGVQKALYRRRLTMGTGATTLTESRPWLPTATLALYAAPKLTVFGSYTRGMEESGNAPNSTNNRGEALPSITTSQLDAGARFIITPSVSAVGTLFQVQKPYVGISPTNFFAQIGTIRHRGFEFSVAGRVIEGLTVTTGAVFLQARLSGPTVDAGLIGRIPIARTPLYGNFNFEYGPPSWNGFSIDVQNEYRSSRVGSIDNTVRIQGRALVNLGARYRFKVAGASAQLRVQARNIFDTFRWDINENQFAYAPEEQRRYMLSVAADF